MTAALASNGKRRIPRFGSADWPGFAAGLPMRLWAHPSLRDYARRSRRWRIGLLAGGVVVGYASVAFGAPNWTSYVAIAVGFFAARIVPEVLGARRPAGPTRLALVADRSPWRYVPPTGRRWLTAAIALAGMSTVATQVSTSRPIAEDLTPLGVSAVLAIASLVAVARISRRSHAAGSADDLVVDDAIRRLATNGVVAAWAALQFMLVWALIPTPATGAEGTSLSAGLATGISYVAQVGLLAAWAWVPTRVTPDR